MDCDKHFILNQNIHSHENQVNFESIEWDTNLNRRILDKFTQNAPSLGYDATCNDLFEDFEEVENSSKAIESIKKMPKDYSWFVSRIYISTNCSEALEVEEQLELRTSTDGILLVRHVHKLSRPSSLFKMLSKIETKNLKIFKISRMEFSFKQLSKVIHLWANIRNMEIQECQGLGSFCDMKINPAARLQLTWIYFYKSLIKSFDLKGLVKIFQQNESLTKQLRISISDSLFSGIKNIDL